MAFQQPDAKTIERMTPESLGALVEALEQRRSEAVEPFDEQIKFYRHLLAQKVKNAKTTS